MAKIILNIEAESPEDLQSALRGLAYVGSAPPAAPAPEPEATTEDPKPKSTRKAKEPAAGAAAPAENPEASSAGGATPDPQASAAPAADEPAQASSAQTETASGGDSGSATTASPSDVTLESVKAALTAALGRTNAKVCQQAVAGVTGGTTSLTVVASDMPDKLAAVQAALEAL